MSCDDCGAAAERVQLLLVTADLGDGAFLATLCAVCWHRRCYRADLLERRRAAFKGSAVARSELGVPAHDRRLPGSAGGAADVFPGDAGVA